MVTASVVLTAADGTRKTITASATIGTTQGNVTVLPPLQTVSDLVVISANNTVLDGLDLLKGVRVLNGITGWEIKNSKVHAGPTYCVDAKYSGKAGAGEISNVQVIDDAGNTAALINISAGSLIQGIEMIGSKQQVIGSWDGVQLLDFYGHGLVNTSGTAHCENLYFGGSSGGTVIRNGVLENLLSQTACIFFDTKNGAVNGVTIDQLTLAGGGYCFYGGGSLASNVSMTNVTFSRKFFPKGGQFGPVTSRPSGAGCVWSNNAMDDGTPV